MAAYTRTSCARCCQPFWRSREEEAAAAAGAAEEQGPASAAAAADAGLCRRCRSGVEEPSCGICLEPLREPFRYALIRSESWENQRCGHRYCRACVRAHAMSKLNDGVWNIRCPGERCPYLLVEADLQKLFVPSEARPAWPPAANAKEVEEGQAVLQRYRDLRGAHYGAHLRAVLFQATTPPPAAAPPVPSAEYAESGDDGFQTWALNECQACPRCLVIIRKETGCNHVECRCGTAFCFCCGAPAQGGSCCCRAPKGSESGQAAALPRLGRWLQVQGKLPA